MMRASRKQPKTLFFFKTPNLEHLTVGGMFSVCLSQDCQHRTRSRPLRKLRPEGETNRKYICRITTRKIKLRRLSQGKRFRLKAHECPILQEGHELAPISPKYHSSVCSETTVITDQRSIFPRLQSWSLAIPEVPRQFLQHHR